MNTRYIGDDIDVELPQVVDATRTVVDLTSATITASAKGPGGVVIASDQFFLDDPTNGICRVRWKSVTTAGFAPGSYSYDVVARLADGSTHTIGWGDFTAVVRITPTPN
jgi:hypothetical protein